MTDLILDVQERRIERSRRYSQASDRALALSQRAQKRLTFLTMFGGSRNFPSTGKALLDAACRRSRLAAALHNAAVRTLTGGGAK